MVKPLFWHQGLFLQPHHFQLSDLYNRSHTDPWYRFAAPHFWGAGSFKIDEAALAGHVFGMVAGEFVFPDHTHVVLGENALIQARSFETAWTDGGRAFNVFLGLKKWHDDNANVTAVEDAGDLSRVSTRFFSLSAPNEVADLHGDGPKAEVRQMQFLVKIFWETEMDFQGEYQLIPIARLKRHLDDVVVDKEFIPPCLTIAGSDVLAGIVKEIRDQVFSKTRQLEAVKRAKGVHTAEFGSRDMVYMMALRSLNRYVPLLIHMTGVVQCHPWAVYGLLKQIVGELSSFSATVSATGELEDGTALMADYGHQKLWACFSGARLLITRLLDEITAGPEYIIPLPFDGTYFTADLPPALFEGSNRFYLVLESQHQAEVIIDAMAGIAKLSARESLPILIAQSLPGIRLSYLETTPQELPRKANALYFRIDHHGKQWEPVPRGNNIALYWDMAPEDLSVELMIVKRN